MIYHVCDDIEETARQQPSPLWINAQFLQKAISIGNLNEFGTFVQNFQDAIQGFFSILIRQVHSKLGIHC